MASSPSRIAVQEGGTYIDSTIIKIQRLIHAMSFSMTETTIKEFNDTLCKKSLQDIAWIHAQFNYPHPFLILPETPARSLINPCQNMFIRASVLICLLFFGDFKTDVDSHQPDHGVISHPPYGISEISIHEDEYDKLATQSRLDGNEESSKPATTVKQRKRKNRKRKNKGVVNGTPSQGSPSSTESGGPVNELTKNTISPDLLEFPTSPTPYAISADPGSSPHPNPIRARSITAREKDLLDSLYEMLVNWANRNDTRALQRIEAQSSPLGSHGGTISGQKTAQKRKSNHHSKEVRKHRQAIQC
ncbi:unnamed protein product [Penicillium discolor]